MATSRTSASSVKQSDPLRFLLSLVLAVGVLYAGKPVVLPLALALLLAFILTPMVMAVQRRGLRRINAVLLVLSFTLVVVGGVGYGVGTQMAKLANEMPNNAKNLKTKIDALRTSGAGPFSRAIGAFQGVGAAAEKKPTGKHDEVPSTAPSEPTVIAAPQSSAFDKLSAIAMATVEPVADTFLIFILVAFMLIRREDMRNRVIGLLGHGQLTGTTRVFVESAERISRLLLMQLCVNTVFGIVFALALLIIGVPYWFLWGFLTVVLRFVPYVGSWMAAMLPVLLSFAVAPTWSQPITVLIVFMTLDLVTGNVIEPLLFGHSTGVTPVALLIAAVFWTWVWGPLGLILSTPLTVCLVVMGQNIPSLRFLSLLMGDEAALEPHVAYYQRLLAGDKNEALLIAKQYGTSHGWDQLPDGVVVPALKMARRDRNHSGLNAQDEAFIFDSTEDVIETLRTAQAPLGPAIMGSLVIGCTAHHRAEELSLQMLASTLAPACGLEIISTRVLPIEIEAKVEREKPAIVFIAVLPPGGVSQARHLCKRLRAKFADLKIVVGYFGKVRDFDRLLTTMRSAGASYVSTSVIQSRNQIRALLPAIGETSSAIEQTPFIASSTE